MDSAKVKFAAVGMPLGREARRISRLVVSLVKAKANWVGELARKKSAAVLRLCHFARECRLRFASKGGIRFSAR